MNMIKKTMISALLALSALGLTTSLPAVADGASDAAMYCTGCHDGLTVNGVTVGGGQRSCPQRTVAEWTVTIDRMNGKGCSVPAGSIAGIANYLASLGGTTTTSSSISTSTSSTTTSSTVVVDTICYRGDGTWFLSMGSYPCPSGTSTTPPPKCSSGYATFDGAAWTCLTTTTTSTSSTSTTYITTTTISGIPCYSPTPDGLSYITEISYTGFCSATSSYSPPPPCPDGTLSIFPEHTWLCTPSTGSTTTTSSTTTTTVPIFATPYDAANYYCTGCHNGLVITGVQGPVIGGGERLCPQRTASEWTATIERMNNKGCSVPSDMVGSIANYLANFWNSSTAPTTTSTTSTTTTSSTTTTTLCNTYVNGTTQYPYSGKGSCHGHPDNDSSSGHVVRDEKWCRKHMTHFNSSGNHVHAYPHPVCM